MRGDMFVPQLFIFLMVAIGPPSQSLGAGTLTGHETARPKSTAQPNETQLAGIVATMMNAADGTGWAVSHRKLSAGQLAKAAAILNAESRARAVLQPLEEAYSLEWSPDGFDGRIVLHMHRFRDAAAARRYHGFAQELLRKQDELWAKPDGPYQVLETRYRPQPSSAGVQQVLRADKRLRPRGAATALNLTTFLFQHENLCLEVSWFDLPVDETWTGNVVRQVIDSPLPPLRTEKD